MKRRMIAVFLVTGLLFFSCGTPVEEIIVIEMPFTYGGIVPVEMSNGSGTGFVIQDEGESYLIVTAAHVVEDFDTAIILGIESKVLAVDYETDLAIIRVPKSGQNWKIWPISDAKIEEKCRVVGYIWPNEPDKPLFVIYWGRVTSVNWNKMVSFNGGAFPGVSGGPLINEKGEVTAICSCCDMAWGLPMETAVLLSPSSNIRALMVTIKEIVTTQPSGEQK